MHKLIEQLQEYLAEQKNITDYQACQILAMIRDYKPVKLQWEADKDKWVAWTIKEWKVKFEIQFNKITNTFRLYYSNYLINDEFSTLKETQQYAQNVFDVLAISCFKRD